MKNKKLLGMTLSIILLSIILLINIVEATNHEQFIKNPLTQQKIKPIGCYQGLIIGKISNLNRFGTYITFYAKSITVFPRRNHFHGYEVIRLCRPYFGILNQRLICALGMVLVGW